VRDQACGVVVMTDVVVKFDLKDADTEVKLFEAVNNFAAEREENSELLEIEADAPMIMVKTTSHGEAFKKSVIFQDKADAEHFMYYWRRYLRVA